MLDQPLGTHVPRITFQDTNIVGNVYFLTYFRWQAECLARLRREDPMAVALRAGQPVKCSMQYSDPKGATIGDSVQVSLSSTDGSTLRSEIRAGSEGQLPVVASGKMHFVSTPNTLPSPNGPCYAHAADPDDSCISPLSLIALQGKCRELFLADFAPLTLRQVAARSLLLQTTEASVEILDTPIRDIDGVLVEMRLTAVKCGQLTVRFDYLARSGSTTHCVAVGHQVISTKHSEGDCVNPCPLPVELGLALRGFAAAGSLRAKIDDIVEFSANASIRRDLDDETQHSGVPAVRTGNQCVDQ